MKLLFALLAIWLLGFGAHLILPGRDFGRLIKLPFVVDWESALGVLGVVFFVIILLRYILPLFTNLPGSTSVYDKRR